MSTIRIISIAILVLIVGIGHGTVGMIHESVVAEESGICGRTPEIAAAIVAEIQKTRADATCADVTADELQAVDGKLAISPSDLQPGDFYGLSTVNELSITGGSSKVVPTGTFEGLESLKRLVLESESVVALRDGTFNGLGQVTRLDISGDNIKALPRDVFADLDNLEALLVHGDSITSFPRGVFDGLNRLRILDLHSQSVKSLSRGVLTGMPRLRTLHFRNQNTGVLESGVFIDLTNLDLLVLDGSGITQLGVDVFAGLDNLRSLHLHDNGLTALPPGVFRHLANLKILHLHANEIGSLSSGAFEGLDNVNQIYLHGNAISRVSADAFLGLKNVVELHLHGNELTELPDDLFKGLRRLEELFLYDNELTDISGLDLSDQTALQWLSVADNNLTRLPDFLFLTPPCSLRFIDIEGNAFDGVPSTTVDGVEYRFIDTLPQSKRGNCGSSAGLTGLFTGDVQLTSNDLALIRDNYTNLELLGIGNTGTSAEEVLDLLTNGRFMALEGVDLSGNDLSAWNELEPGTLGSAISRFKQLTALDLSEAGIDGETALEVLQHVDSDFQRFSFSDNDLSSWNDPDMSDDVMEALSRLPKSTWTVIFLANAGLDSVAADSIVPSIARTDNENEHVHLDLSGNELTRVESEWFEEWEVLTELELADNAIQTIDPTVFAPLAQYLEELTLDGNPLDPIPSREEFEEVLPNLTELKLPIVETEEVVETDKPRAVRLPITGGFTLGHNGLLFLLLFGTTAVAVGTAMAVMVRRTRPRW